MDWTGLLAWSINQKNGEKFDMNIKPMDEQTKKWLLEALENCQVDEFKRMKELLELIAKPEMENEEEQRLQWFDELMEILDALDRANDFCQVGGLALMFNYFHSTKFDSIKIQCLRIITNSNQNNTFVQEYCGQNGYLALLNDIGNQTLKIKEQVIASISSMVRGECLNNKRRFIDSNGINIILNHLDSNRCIEKIANIIRDLLYYDEKLHQTYHDLSKFANTSGQQNKKASYSLTKDINEELKLDNKLPENQKYRGIVKKILIETDFLSLVDKFLIDTSYKNSDGRMSYLACAQTLSQIHHNQQLVVKIKTHYSKLIQEVDKDEAEIQLCLQFN